MDIMNIIIVLIIVACIIWLLLVFSINSGGNDPNGLSKIEKILNSNNDWLIYRWALAREEQKTGEFKYTPSWYFDDPTEQQLQRINEIGELKGKLTKGEASDIIGLFEPAEKEDIEILKFFKISLKDTDMNQSKARYEVIKLFSNYPEKLEYWRKHIDT